MAKSFDPEKDQVLSSEGDDIMSQINSPETWQQAFQRQGVEGQIIIVLKYSAQNQPTLSAELKFPAKQYTMKFLPRKKEIR
jgi:hypothetical protein